jgi:radical SAM superfamily enzyme YgiQ (UPF0313 family)
MNELNMKPRKYIDFWKYEGSNIVAGSINGTYEFDQIASFIWTKCDGHHTVKQIINDLARACNMEDEIEIIKNDVLSLLHEWKYNQLIIMNYHPLHAFSEYDSDTLYDIEVSSSNADVLLIAPPSPNPTTGMNVKIQGTFPLGVGYISAVLKQYNYSVEVVNLWLHQINEKTVRWLIEKVNPKILGISTMTDNFLNGITIATIAKEYNREIVTVFGGPHVTFTDQESLENYPVIDVIVRNEGEFSMVELADYYLRNSGSLHNIKGITFRDNEKIIRNPRRALIKDLDALPLPDRAHVDFKKSMIGIQTSRGCPGACIFCVASTMAGGYYRVRSAEKVVEEIDYLYKQGARKFFFQDDTFTADIVRLRSILKLIREKNLHIEWNAESRVDIVDKDPLIFLEMQKSGCRTVQFGVEAGSQEQLDKLKKNISVDQIFRAVTAAKSAGLDVVCTMLMGHPYDTAQSIQSSIEFAEKLIEWGAFVLFSIVCPYPGTQIRAKAEQYKVTIHETSYNDYFVSNAFMDTAYLTADQIRNFYFDGMRKVIHLNIHKDAEKFTAVTG